MSAPIVPGASWDAVATARRPGHCHCGKALTGKQTVACSDAHRFRRWSGARPRLREIKRVVLGSVKSNVLGLLTDYGWWAKRELADAIGTTTEVVGSKIRDLRGCQACKGRPCRIEGHQAHRFRILSRRVEGAHHYEYQLQRGR